MAISTVTSEALQLKIRQLLPSQQGFGTDLSASDTIIPIIDLTASAEGSDVREDLQKALSFGSVTSFDVRNATTTIINTTGFFRIVGSVNYQAITGSTAYSEIYLRDGSTDKVIYQFLAPAQATPNTTIAMYDFVVFLPVGHSVKTFTNSASVGLAGNTRQIADLNGTLVQPVGFDPQ
tara:strand:+ start:1213 stop:1746 length:534 start_codon:yes stop_codon:yes gene_type:complete